MASSASAAATARSPLAECKSIRHKNYQQKEIFPLGKTIIRGKGGDFHAAAQNTLDIKEMPAANSSVSLGGKSTLLWLSPDEWLLWSGSEAAHRKQLAALQAAFAAPHAAAIDVSDYYTLIRLGGSKATDVLAHGCPLDLRDSALPPGACAQSHYRNAGMLLYRGKSGYDVQVRWSYAHYLWSYFSEVSALL